MRSARAAAASAAIVLSLLLPYEPALHAQAPSGPAPAPVSQPLKVGLSLSLTGTEAENGRQVLIALQIWCDDVNAKGGLLGRPVALVHYDDQSNPAMVPRLYYKLLTEDKVDLTLGPYGRNAGAAAMRVLMNFNRATVGILGVGVNRVFSYWRYFAMAPAGAEGFKSFSKGFFDLAAAQRPRPQTAALVSLDAESTGLTAAAARENAAGYGLDVVYDDKYSQAITDFAPMIRMLQTRRADVVFVSADHAETPAIIRAAKQTGLAPMMFGGALSGLLSTATKAELGPLLDGMVTAQSFVPASTLNFPGLSDVIRRYRAAAVEQHADAVGYNHAPFGYAAGQVLAQAVEGTSSTDQDRIADYIHNHRFATVVGDIEYDGEGEWSKPRMLWTQFQNVVAKDVEQFGADRVQPIVWPSQYQTSGLVYPYSGAVKK